MVCSGNVDLKSYTVRVFDNFHYQDACEAYDLRFPTAEAALACARKIVEDCVLELGADRSSISLFERYKTFGEDPMIIAPAAEADVPFSAWEYAETLCGSHAPQPESFPAED